MLAKHDQPCSLIQFICVQATATKQIYNINAEALRAKDCECQLHGAVVRSHATRWFMCVWQSSSLMFGCYLLCKDKRHW